MSFRSIEEVKSYLDSIPQFGSSGKDAADFNLDRFRRFVREMGNPQQAFPTIHVGGTNGKGSTCQILATIYQEAGKSVGLYTSPHILDYTERFKINGEAIKWEQLLAFFRQHEELLTRHRLTYFELSTAIAFWYFADQKTDLAIIEVGLGGRLDATNIIRPLASVITNVSLDHTDILGETIAQIAREKAGIIKEGVPVVVGNVSEEAERVIEEVAAENNSPVHKSSDLNPRFKGGRYVLHTRDGVKSFISDLKTPIQAHNIAVAWEVVRLLQPRFAVAEEQFKDALAQLRSIYPSLGRFEKISKHHKWYFDGAHNLEAVRAMKQMIRRMAPVNNAVLVFSLMQDKAGKELLNEFSEFNKLFYHELNTRRAARYEYIKQRLPSVAKFPATEQQQNRLLEEFETELVIFAGSFYFYVTVRDWLTSFTKSR